jgi:hypothetical protein
MSRVFSVVIFKNTYFKFTRGPAHEFYYSIQKTQDLELVHAAMSLGMSIDAADEMGRTLLGSALSNDGCGWDMEAVKTFLAMGARPDIPGTWNNLTPLHLVFRNGESRLTRKEELCAFELMIKQPGLDLASALLRTDDRGRTPLHMLFSRSLNNWEEEDVQLSKLHAMMAMGLPEGALSVRDRKGQTVIDCAAQFCKSAVPGIRRYERAAERWSALRGSWIAGVIDMASVRGTTPFPGCGSCTSLLAEWRQAVQALDTDKEPSCVFRSCVACLQPLAFYYYETKRWSGCCRSGEFRKWHQCEICPNTNFCAECVMLHSHHQQHLRLQHHVHAHDEVCIN